MRSGLDPDAAGSAGTTSSLGSADPARNSRPDPPMAATFDPGFATTQQAPAPAEDTRLLVPRARRIIPIPAVFAVFVFAAFFILFATLNPILGQSIVAVATLTLLATTAFAYVMLAPNGDILDPMRVVSVYFMIVFGVSCLALDGLRWHYTQPFTNLLPGAALYSLAAYLMILIGYHIPFWGRMPEQIPFREETYNSTLTATLGMMLFLVGLASWSILIILVGGLEGLIYSDRARGEFFIGFGQFFWGSLFMFPGATLYWSAMSTKKRGFVVWVHAIPLVIAFMTFLVLQGRMRALNFLILGLFVAHYAIKPLKPVLLGIFGGGGLTLSLLIGVLRSPSTRGASFDDPIGAITLIATNLEEVVRGFILADLSRLRQIVLIFDKVPAWMPHDWGTSFLLFLNPWFRLFGFNEFEMEGIGPRLFRLAHPEAGPLPTGYLPSMLGEMLVNFPWPLACLAFIPYGIALRALYEWLIVRRGDCVSIAIYAILLLQAANVILQSFSHVIFEMMVVILPMLLVSQISKIRRRPVPAFGPN